MFISVRDQGRRRRSQSYGVSKAARSSKLSLLSALTAASHGSNESASTVTQESYSKSSSGSGRRRRSSKHKRHKEVKSPSVISSPQKPKMEKSMSKESVNVFAFLVPDDDQDTPISHSEEPAHVEHEDCHPAEESDAESVVRSQHSDSGISMGNGSICLPDGDTLLNTRLPPLLEDSSDNTDPQGHLVDRPSYSRRLRLKWPDIPPATHKHHMPSPEVRAPSPERIRVRLPITPDESEKEFCIPGNTLTGYELVATKLAQGELPPVFRRFKSVNFRVLLQLQDEIMEMEEQLALWDLADTKNRLNSDGGTSPASRRINWQWGQSDLHANRLQILGRLYIKLEQYYQALVSANKVQTMAASPILADVEAFRAFLKENNPLSVAESKFLDDDDDLIMLKDTPTAAKRANFANDWVPLCILTTTLLPMIAFKFMTGVLNRLILLTALLAAGLSSVERLDRAKVEQHQQWLIACFGVSFFAALLL